MRLRHILFFILLQITLIYAHQDYYDEQYRPQFHFSPQSHWMNDPNGLVYYNGTYHLFYQHYPEDIVWGPMHWGHATSTDLLHWQHQPIALYPDSLGYIFSGSAVIDNTNAAGFGEDAMIAIFTYHDENYQSKGLLNKESQGIAYSIDEGMTFNKYEQNPVLHNSGEQDFRDPNVKWNSDTEKWNMILAAGDIIKIYSSDDLKDWKHESDFKPEGDLKNLGVWECPDLFKMRLKDGSEEKWVMIINHGDKTPNGGSGTRYFVGDFDGSKFINIQPSKWLDYGTDTYAGVTYSNVPDDRRFFIGWMSNWQYAQDVPTSLWRSAMSLPRELKLDKDNSGYFLRQEIVNQFEKLRTNYINYTSVELPVNETGLDLSQAELLFESEVEDLQIIISNDIGEELKLKLDKNRFVIDRSKSGKTDFSEKFADNVQVMPVDDKISRYQLILDRASIELLLNDGKYSMTVIFFPNEKYTNLKISSNNEAELSKFVINKVKRVWNKPSE